MKQAQFVIIKVSSLQPGRLAIQFSDGWSGEVDLSDVIEKHPTLQRLKQPEVVSNVTVDESSRGVIFAGNDELTLASDNLRALAIEQTGEFSHQQLIGWMQHHDLSLKTAAQSLGISRRMLAYYRSGERPIPRTVGLAMLGWDSMKSGHHLSEYSCLA